MSGFNGMTDWEESLEAGRQAITEKARKAGIALKTSIGYTPEGCTLARKILKENDVRIDPGLTGWEIVDLANQVLEGRG